MNGSELRAGTRIDNRYVLKEFKGRGSYGEVWLAEDEDLGLELALKLYITLDDNGQEEFKEEFKISSNLIHQNLLTARYYSVWNHRPFLIMKYCANGSVANKCGNMAERDLWKFIHDVASGLNYLHTQEPPIMHQDIKPENILVDGRDTYLITDFGISTRLRSTMRRQSNRKMEQGAIAYMAPERFLSEPLTVMASDIWSLGVSIYELVTGELPFMGYGGGMLNAGAEIPSLEGSAFSENLNYVMRRCLSKDPWDRPTAEQLVKYSEYVLMGGELRFDAWSNSGPVHIDEEVKLPHTLDLKKGFPKRSNKLIAIAVLAVLICSACIYFFVIRDKSDQSVITLTDTEYSIVEGPDVEEVQLEVVQNDVSMTEYKLNESRVKPSEKKEESHDDNSREKGLTEQLAGDNGSIVSTKPEQNENKTSDELTITVQDVKEELTPKKQDADQQWKTELLTELAGLQVPNELNEYKRRIIEQINRKGSDKKSCQTSIKILMNRITYYNRLIKYNGKFDPKSGGIVIYDALMRDITDPYQKYDPTKWDKAFTRLNRYVLPKYKKELGIK